MKLPHLHIKAKQGQIISPVILAVGARLQPLGSLLVDFLFLDQAIYSSGQVAEFGIQEWERIMTLKLTKQPEIA